MILPRLAYGERNLYLLDSSVFIESDKRLYPIIECPEFWKWIEDGFDKGFVCSLDAVFEEVEAGEGEVVSWAKKMKKHGFFMSLEEEEENDPRGVYACTKQVNEALENEKRYSTGAIIKFSSKADVLLITFALLSRNIVVVTEETRDINNPKKKGGCSVKIPDVCDKLSIRSMDTEEMLRKEGAEHVLALGRGNPAKKSK